MSGAVNRNVRHMYIQFNLTIIIPSCYVILCSMIICPPGHIDNMLYHFRETSDGEKINSIKQ